MRITKWHIALVLRVALAAMLAVLLLAEALDVLPQAAVAACRLALVEASKLFVW